MDTTPEEQAEARRDQAWDWTGFTYQERVFVEAYVGHCKLSTSQAAIAAGYTEAYARQQGYRMKRRVHVRARIEEMLEAGAMGPREVIASITDEATWDIEDFFRFENDRPVFDPDRARQRGVLHLIEGFDYSKSGDLIVRFPSKSAARVVLAKHHKLLTDRVEHSGNIDVLTASDEELERITGRSRGGGA